MKFQFVCNAALSLEHTVVQYDYSFQHRAQHSTAQHIKKGTSPKKGIPAFSYDR